MIKKIIKVWKQEWKEFKQDKSIHPFMWLGGMWLNLLCSIVVVSPYSFMFILLAIFCVYLFVFH